MPKIEAHEEAVTRNQTVLDCLLQNYSNSPDDFAPWAVTVAFYKAVDVQDCPMRGKRTITTNNSPPR